MRPLYVERRAVAAVGGAGSWRSSRGFTLIELMVVAAIIAVLLTVMAPAIRGIMQTSQSAQAENVVRAALYSARTYAVKKSVVAGLRFQDDGHIVQIYARNMHDTYSQEDFTQPPVYDMKAVEGVEPAKLPGPWRVTVVDVGRGDWWNIGSGGWTVTWVGRTSSGYAAAPEWLDAEHAWFVFPVVLFSPQGRVIFSECKFSGSSSRPWYPTLAGAFGKVTDQESNPNPIPSHSRLKYTNQVAMVGWRCNNYKGGASHNIPVESPSITSHLRLFNYEEFRGLFDAATNVSEQCDALETIVNSSSDFLLDVNTGQVVNKTGGQEISSN